MNFSDVAGRKFSNCNLQRKLTNEEVMQKKWLVYSAGKIGTLLLLQAVFRLMPRYLLMGFLTGAVLAFA